IQLSRLLLLLPGIVWGASFTVVELVLPVVPPVTITLLRSVISVIMLLGMMWFAGGYLPRNAKEWAPFFLLAAINQATPFALTAWGQVYIDGGLASILLSVMPLFTALLAWWFMDDEALTFNKVVGIGLGLLGIVLLMGFDAMQTLGANVLAQLAIVGAALLYAISAVLIRRVYPLQPTGLSAWALRLRITAAQFVAAAILLLPFSLWLDAPWRLHITLDAWGYLIFLGVGVTLLATVTYFYLIEQFGAGTASTTIYLIPVAGVLSGVLILGEKLTGQMAAALVLILGGIFMANR
ncbi:MAG: DMT family transporter, partial [Caldilineaceae bacterium]